eukprot:ctg_1946.g535
MHDENIAHLTLDTQQLGDDGAQCRARQQLQPPRQRSRCAAGSPAEQRVQPEQGAAKVQALARSLHHPRQKQRHCHGGRQRRPETEDRRQVGHAAPRRGEQARRRRLRLLAASEHQPVDDKEQHAKDQIVEGLQSDDLCQPQQRIQWLPRQQHAVAAGHRWRGCRNSTTRASSERE